MKFAKKYGTKPVKINHLYKKQDDKKYKLFKTSNGNHHRSDVVQVLFRKQVAYFGSRQFILYQTQNHAISSLSPQPFPTNFTIQTADGAIIDGTRACMQEQGRNVGWKNQMAPPFTIEEPFTTE